MSEAPDDRPQGPLGRRERRKLEVRTRIYLAAHTLFDEKGALGAALQTLVVRPHS